MFQKPFLILEKLILAYKYQESLMRFLDYKEKFFAWWTD